MRSSCIVVCWCASATAAPLAVHTAEDLPFSAQELDAALESRASLAHPGSRSIEANVTSRDGGVRVEVLGRDRELELDGARGVDAARLVAFAILDLAGDQLDPPPREVKAIDHAPRAELAAWMHAGSRVEGELEVGVGVHGGLRAIAAAGASTRVSLGAARDRAYPLRAGLAWRGPHIARGEIEVRATAIAVLEQARATIARTDAIYGGGASIAWGAPVFGDRAGATLLVGAGVDGYATQIDYRVDGVEAGTTPRATWWVGVGVAGELWR